MRVELALIISIICFCCWCAYILVRMSYSTSSASSSPSSSPSSSSSSVGTANTNSPSQGSIQAASMNYPALAQPNHQYYPLTTTRSYFLNDYHQPFNNNQRPPEAATPAHYYSSQPRPPYSTNSITSWPTTWVRRKKENMDYHHPASRLANWMMPNNLSSAIYVAHPATRWQQAVQPAATELEPDSPETSEATEVQETPESETQESETSDSSEDPQQHQQEATVDDETANEVDEPEPEPEPEVEERAARRSFSEDQSESTERDRNGRPVRTLRRHLVNGKPVKQPKKAKNARAQAKDFESVVSEIDAAEADTSEQQDEGKQQNEARESRPAGSISSLGISQVGGIQKRNEVKPRDSHQHRLSESLSAQQWDDDSGNNGSTNDAKKEAEPELKEDEEQEDDGNSLLDDELDMFAGSTEFPFVQPASGQTRRLKRNIPSNDSNLIKQDLERAEDLAIEVIEQNNQQQPSSAQDPSTQMPPFTQNSQADQNSHPTYGWPPLPLPPPPPPPPSTPTADQAQAQQAPPFISNGHSGGTFEYQPIQSPNQYHPATIWNPDSIFTLKNPLASSSKAKVSKKKQHKKFKKSAMADSKYKAANAHKMRKMSKFKKGGSKKKKKLAKKKLSKKSKEFQASTKGKKGNKGHGQQGAKKGALYINDKGYKKKGFKKAYRKIEAGDHKTYFDTFRDRDHNKNWKNFKDKHHYSQSKKWAGNDAKKFKNFSSKESKKKKLHSAGWRDRAGSEYRKDAKYKKESESARRKKKKKSHEESEHYS